MFGWIPILFPAIRFEKSSVAVYFRFPRSVVDLLLSLNGNPVLFIVAVCCCFVYFQLADAGNKKSEEPLPKLCLRTSFINGRSMLVGFDPSFYLVGFRFE